jgi:hypothetical protein
MADLTTLLAKFLEDLYAGSITLTGDVSAATLTLGGDVVLSRGAANRLDLATGDSLYLVGGGLGVGVVPPGSGNIQVNGSMAAGGAGYIYWNARAALASPADGQLEVTNNAASTAASLGLGPSASATSTRTLVKKVTGIADNSATDVATVTIPNGNHAATIRVTILSSNGSTDAFESSRTALGQVVLARTTGVATVATAATLTLATIATVGGGATHTLAYGATAMVGAVGATQTFTITVTIDDSGNTGSNQAVVLLELINAEASGVTIA